MINSLQHTRSILRSVQIKTTIIFFLSAFYLAFCGISSLFGVSYGVDPHLVKFCSVTAPACALLFAITLVIRWIARTMGD
jgi:uncharacterized membrane protein